MTLISGEKPFCIHVPYEIHEKGKMKTSKPLLVYFHGYKENLQLFKKKCSTIIESFKAYHLLLQGPYPIYERRNEKSLREWGTAWYLYDGNQEQFLQSLEKTSGFIDHVLADVRKKCQIQRICLIGYSMGGYLAGYYALTRAQSVNELIVAGSRIKTEILDGEWNTVKHLQILAIHGKQDNLVDYKPQRDEIYRMKKKGIKADFKLIDQKHILNERYIQCICDWLIKKEYS